MSQFSVVVTNDCMCCSVSAAVSEVVDKSVLKLLVASSKDTTDIMVCHLLHSCEFLLQCCNYLVHHRKRPSTTRVIAARVLNTFDVNVV